MASPAVEDSNCRCPWPMRPIGFADRDRRRNSWVSLWKYRSSDR